MEGDGQAREVKPRFAASCSYSPFVYCSICSVFDQILAVFTLAEVKVPMIARVSTSAKVSTTAKVALWLSISPSNFLIFNYHSLSYGSRCWS